MVSAQEDLARAFDEGVYAMSRALQGGSEPVNPYRSPESECCASGRCEVCCPGWVW